MPPSASGYSNGRGTASNMTFAPSSAPKPLERGVYVPTVAFFTPEDTIDEQTTRTHAVNLARAGVAGIVTHGSNGEAVHLDHAERILVTRITREALDEAGYTHLPVVVGCGAQSTRETVQLCREAAQAGGSAVLVLPPSYYGGLLTTELILAHFRAVADASPLPVLIYNYPGACSGLDLSSDVILALAEHPNIQGVKLTCGNTGKLARVVDGVKRMAGGGSGGGKTWRTFGGSADFTIQGLAAGGDGIIAGSANLAPRACVEVTRLWDGGKLAQARDMQGVVARGDWTMIQGGFVSVKVGLQKYFGYGGEPRPPCALPQGKALAKQEEGFAEMMALEKRLSGAA